MDLQEMKIRRDAIRDKMKRADKERKELLSLLCRANAKYYRYLEGYNCLDQEIAEYYVESIDTKVTRSRPKDLISEIEIEGLTTEQIEALAARLQQMQEDKEAIERAEEDIEEEEED